MVLDVAKFLEAQKTVPMQAHNPNLCNECSRGLLVVINGHGPGRGPDRGGAAMVIIEAHGPGRCRGPEAWPWSMVLVLVLVVILEAQ